jgi:NifU-like protein involved in Fe-S cluster formation
MTADPYSTKVRALFANPAHAGRLEAAVTVTLDEQGMCLQLSALARGGRIEALRFRAWGCPHFIAAAERLCARYEGRAAADLESAGANEFMQSLGIPVEKTGRILVIEDAARALGGKLREISKSET